MSGGEDQSGVVLHTAAPLSSSPPFTALCVISGAERSSRAGGRLVSRAAAANSIAEGGRDKAGCLRTRRSRGVEGIGWRVRANGTKSKEHAHPKKCFKPGAGPQRKNDNEKKGVCTLDCSSRLHLIVTHVADTPA